MDFYYYIRFPFNDREWFKKLGIGSIVFLIPIINIIAIGYFVQCIRLGAKGRRILPFWHNWEGLLRDGIIAIIISLAYIIPPCLLWPLFLAVPVIGIFMQSTIFLIAGLMIPMAVANYAVTDEIIDAFKLGRILGQLGEVLNDYVVIYLIMVIINSIFIALIFALPILALLGAIVNFYLGVIFANFIGQLFRNTTCK
ncbi:MAG TPA: DUF4013 domain-containing protein [Syntrophomonadaceae bacterium]|nr:DUF4013 domain-containing protein [Syntrophomonadaceae bacterium]